MIFNRIIYVLLFFKAYKYIIYAGGMDSAADYPFAGRDDQDCKFKAESVACKINGYKDIQPGKNN